MKAHDRLKHDQELQKLKFKLADTSAKYNQAVKSLAQMEREIEAHRSIKPLHSPAIKPLTKSAGAEATAVLVLSDWHYEEEVRKASVSGLNEFNLAIANRRI